MTGSSSPSAPRAGTFFAQALRSFNDGMMSYNNPSNFERVRRYRDDFQTGQENRQIGQALDANDPVASRQLQSQFLQNGQLDAAYRMQALERQMTDYLSRQGVPVTPHLQGIMRRAMTSTNLPGELPMLFNSALMGGVPANVLRGLMSVLGRGG